MAMHFVKQRNKKQQALSAAMPYRRNPESTPVAEDTAKAEQMFGNRYDMILMAAQRAYDLLKGVEPMVQGKKHSAIVTAMLEVEAGKVTKDYVPKFRKLSAPKTKQ